MSLLSDPVAGSTDGSAAVGTTSYPIPANAYFVDPAGSDINPGTQAAPWLTLGHAVKVAPSGSTIVMRGGVYHESVKVPATKQLTIQSYPDEAVWLDGSVPVTNWVQDSPGVWRSDNWVARFAAVDYNPAAAQFWGPVNSISPMAGHPDQVSLNGNQLTQVGSLSQVGQDDFYVDYLTQQLYIGDDPTGQMVDGSTLTNALTINSAGTVVRGIGVRDYATPYNAAGTIQLSGNNDVLENVEVDDSATKAIGVGGQYDTLSNVTTARAGQVGVAGHQADDLLVTDSLFDTDNQQNFNISPVAGGMKCTSCRYADVTHNTFVDNIGNALWFDTSSYADGVYSNLMVDNSGPGVHFEVSGYETAADNVIVNPGQAGILVADANNARLWNNTVLNPTGFGISLVDGWRTASDPAERQWRDPRYPNDPNVTWVTNNADIHNNVVEGGAATAVVSVNDVTHTNTAGQMVTSSNNAFYRPSAMAPKWVFAWCNPGHKPAMLAFTTLAAMQNATGQETGSMEQVGGTDPYAQDGSATAGYSYAAPAGSPAIGAGLPLPDDIAQALGQPSGQPVNIGTLTR